MNSRCPVLIRGLLDDQGFKAGDWTLDYLERKVGKIGVKVEEAQPTGLKGGEPESSARRSFGRGIELEIPFQELASAIRTGSRNIYMSTQTIPVDDEGRPATFGQLMEVLIGDIPIRPRLVGPLIPANINMWIGRSDAQTCSGLHHDYHDNLYCLLRGTKRFLLVSPEYA